MRIFDGHNDALLSLHLPERGKNRSFFERSDVGHLDLPRARDGGFGGGIFAIFVPNPEGAKPHDPDAPPEPSPPIEQEYAQRFSMAMLARAFRLEQQAGGAIAIVRTIDQLRAAWQDDQLVMSLHFEGAEAIDPQLEALEVFYAAGLRSLGLVWSRPNAFAHGVPFCFPHSPDIGPGLTDAGRRLVKRSNELGVLIDLSHLNERGFWDVAEISQAPLVASHSNAHAVCPSPRNLTDRQLDAVRDSGGVVGLNFCVAFVRPDGDNNDDTPLAALADHIDYLVDRMGIDHVALGSDFDGATMPRELADAAQLGKLVEVLRGRGYDDPALAKIGHENWFRVLAQTWQ